MQHLTPVGLSKDGKNLILVSDTGEEFAVPADQRLRTALRGDHARLGQWENKMESALRPRDIQARIRAGESAEDVAAAAQSTVEAIMPFAGPVLAERAHIAELARTSSIRRASADASPIARTLADAAPVHLGTLSVRADDVTWDAWRRDDGRWTLVATYAAQGTARRAEFSFDQPGRYVVAENPEALLLTGEAVAEAGSEAPAAPRRLASVPAATYGDDELPLGDDALALVRERNAGQAAPAEAAVEAAVEEPEPVAEPANEPTTEVPTGSFDDLAADHADADWISDLRPAAPAEDRSATEEPASADAEADQTSDAPRDQPAEETESGHPRRKGRSSVPSWDEIMFGGGKAD